MPTNINFSLGKCLQIADKRQPNDINLEESAEKLQSNVYKHQFLAWECLGKPDKRLLSASGFVEVSRGSNNDPCPSVDVPGASVDFNLRWDYQQNIEKRSLRTGPLLLLLIFLEM